LIVSCKTGADGTPRKGLSQSLRVFLSAATLIVVPAMLLNQWVQEFHKYTIDGHLSILVIQSNQEFPPPEELSKYTPTLVGLRSLLLLIA
jgi:SNF2 family DNA or RNA helicase